MRKQGPLDLWSLAGELKSRFVSRFQDMKAMQITTLVNTLVVENKISKLSRHRDLFSVLSNSGIYDKSESNWNQQVK